MTSVTSGLKPKLLESLSSGLVRLTSVAIQWQISLHSGLSLLGASGSVRARVSWAVFDFVVVQSSGTASMNSMSGCFCTREGLMVLPTSAVAFSQKMDTVRSGLKVSMTVGMISAFLSLHTSLSIAQIFVLIYSVLIYEVLLATIMVDFPQRCLMLGG